ncbi:mannosyltransferase [Tenacibaculum maritimum]|nr:mannosyltransferase [Tenacibaculum maritimum]MCD9582067.1 mannosyltransferase [Tenacibaculum maritimum]MCD9636444.1 mannosyltransferase [Tenacibaculum maritimum]CAA0153707.1 conserved membrane hypothetical protein [Tenacibaculum maritimum]CAA0155714.1 conserved membrane hypothetical protein [Tenacibaculum maritimum]CAA0204176.1 conserved membrane hypothetical protein [Tenacibaculum maritimum]
MSFSLKKYTPIALLFFSCLLYFLVGYTIERTQFNYLIFLWGALFCCFYYLINNKQVSFLSLAIASVLFRMIFLISMPNLSQDFYRFIWDGRMLYEGLNPYLYLPETFIKEQNYPIHQALELYNGMGPLNGSHYTNYPPLNQLCFLIAAIFGNHSILGSVITMRAIIILADIGIMYIGKQLLEKLHLPIKNIFWYALNPFIIIELTGNLHFEPVMLFFLILSIYKLYQGKWGLAGMLLACSVSIKLIPLLFLPLFYQWFLNPVNKSKKTTALSKLQQTPYNLINLLLFYSIVIVVTIAFFLPFYSSQLVENYSNSVGLWFRNFEFNASGYYIAREIGFLFRGYNEIAIIGKIIPILAILFILGITFFKKNITIQQLIVGMLFSLSFYYFVSTTVHPWYLATLIILAVFTQYRFPIIWSLVIILTYQAYSNIPWKENLWFVFIEYSILYAFLLKELLFPTPKPQYSNYYDI